MSNPGVYLSSINTVTPERREHARNALLLTIRDLSKHKRYIHNCNGDRVYPGLDLEQQLDMLEAATAARLDAKEAERTARREAAALWEAGREAREKEEAERKARLIATRAKRAERIARNGHPRRLTLFTAAGAGCSVPCERTDRQHYFRIKPAAAKRAWLALGEQVPDRMSIAGECRAGLVVTDITHDHLGVSFCCPELTAQLSRAELKVLVAAEVKAFDWAGVVFSGPCGGHNAAKIPGWIICPNWLHGLLGAARLLRWYPTSTNGSWRNSGRIAIPAKLVAAIEKAIADLAK
jgi:hypothetical protein